MEQDIRKAEGESFIGREKARGCKIQSLVSAYDDAIFMRLFGGRPVPVCLKDIGRRPHYKNAFSSCA